MSADRDEMAEAIRPVLSEYGAWGTVPPEHPLGVPVWGDSLSTESSDCPESIADAVLAAGWRKVPSREALQQVLIETGNLSPAKKHRHAGEMADAILALINGDYAESSPVGNGERKETGEK